VSVCRRKNPSFNELTDTSIHNIRQTCVHKPSNHATAAAQQINSLDHTPRISLIHAHTSSVFVPRKPSRTLRPQDTSALVPKCLTLWHRCRSVLWPKCQVNCAILYTSYAFDITLYCTYGKLQHISSPNLSTTATNVVFLVVFRVLVVIRFSKD